MPLQVTSAHSPENQAELVPGPDPDKIKKIEPEPLLVQHVKGQPDSPTSSHFC